jgi:hypothetical protein
MHLHGRMLYRLYTDSNYFFMDYKLRMSWRSKCVCRFHSDGGAIEPGNMPSFSSPAAHPGRVENWRAR